jgi:hypothetical protein
MFETGTIRSFTSLAQISVQRIHSEVQRSLVGNTKGYIYVGFIIDIVVCWIFVIDSVIPPITGEDKDRSRIVAARVEDTFLFVVFSSGNRYTRYRSSRMYEPRNGQLEEESIEKEFLHHHLVGRRDWVQLKASFR